MKEVIIVPNHVENLIRISGDEQKIREILETIKNDEYGIGTVDFNKIIPMPKSLDIECGSRTDKGLKAYTDFASSYAKGENIPIRSEQAYLKKRKDISSEEWELGKTAYQNIKKYGYSTWYDWRVNNWGTKWNAYGYEEDHQYENDNILRFQTAWSAPEPILEKLSKMYPDITFYHAWADEDLGYNCGLREYLGGKKSGEYITDDQKEALKFATLVWNLESEEIDELFSKDKILSIEEQNKEIKTQSLTDEKLEVVEILGQTALFTNGRVTDEELPDGLYKYDLREGENISFATIEKSVTVNHSGTILVKSPLDFYGQRYLVLDDDTSPNFLGYSLTPEEFMETDFTQSEEQDEEDTQTMGGMIL